MTAAWPSAKISPYPDNESFAHLYGDPRASSAREQGASRLRKLFRSAKTRIDIGWHFTNAEFEIFHAFLRWPISNGADDFTMDVWTGSAYQNLTVRFIPDSIAVKPDDGEWRVDASLETDELPVMSSGALDALIGGAGSGLPAWPTSYIPPYTLSSGLALKLPSGVLRSDFEGAYTQMRVPFKSAPASYSASIPMTNAQYDAWRAFRVYRLGLGVKWFTLPVMRGNSYETNAVRIAKDGARATRQGPDWLLHLNVELRDLLPSPASVLV